MNKLLLQFKEPKPSSGFIASNWTVIPNVGVNGIFPFTFNLPKIVQDAISMPISEKELSTVDMNRSKLLVRMFPEKVAEKPSGNQVISVSKGMKNFLSGIFSNGDITCKYDGTTLEYVQALCGPASRLSRPDFMVVVNDKDLNWVALAVAEFKDTSISPLEQLGQAFCSGCNIILSHLRYGFTFAECAVPLILTNSNLYQFAWMSLLDNAFPVLHVTSSVLDAFSDSVKIAEHLLRIRRFCLKQAAEIKRRSENGLEKTKEVECSLSVDADSENQETIFSGGFVMTRKSLFIISGEYSRH